MSVMLRMPTICLLSKTGTRVTPDFFISLIQYLIARPGGTVTKGLLMISKTLTLERFFLFGPASTTLVTISVLVRMPYASSLFLRSTTKLETFSFCIFCKASATVSHIRHKAPPSFPSLGLTEPNIVLSSLYLFRGYQRVEEILPASIFLILRNVLGCQGEKRKL